MYNEYTLKEIIEKLKSNNINNFKYDNNEYYTDITFEKDENVELIFEAKNRVISEEIINCSVNTLENLDSYKEKAIQYMNNWIKADKYNYWLIDIFFGNYNYAYNDNMFNGFTMTFGKNYDNYDGCYERYTVKFRKNGFPVGLEIWID